jgi:hypothetical protein
VIRQADVIFVQDRSTDRAVSKQPDAEHRRIVFSYYHRLSGGLPLFLSILRRCKTSPRRSEQIRAGWQRRELEEAVYIRASGSPQRGTAGNCLYGNSGARHGMSGLILYNRTFNIGGPQTDYRQYERATGSHERLNE